MSHFHHLIPASPLDDSATYDIAIRVFKKLMMLHFRQYLVQTCTNVICQCGPGAVLVVLILTKVIAKIGRGKHTLGCTKAITLIVFMKFFISGGLSIFIM